MAIVVQKSAGGLAALVAGNEFYSTVASLKKYPSNNSFEAIAAVGSATYINFTPTAAQDFQGVILGLHNTQGDGSTQRSRVITVELEENVPGWTSRLTKTIDTDDLIPDNTWSRCFGLYDLRFDATHTLTAAAATWRLKIYHDGTGSGTFYLLRSENSGDDNIFHLVYSDTTVTLTASDVLVLTDKITMDDDLSLEKVDCANGTQSIAVRSRYQSIYGCIPNTTLGTAPQIYVPSAAAADYTLSMKGCFFVSSYATNLLVGEDADNPLPIATRVFTVDFSDVSTTNQCGFRAGSISSGYGKLAGIELWGEEPTTKWATLNDDAASGQADVKVDGDLTSDWAAGDMIEIGGAQYTNARTYRDYAYNEYREIDSMAHAGGVTTITCTVNLTYNHYVEAGMNLYIVNTTRNVILKGKDGTWNKESWTDMRGGYAKFQGVRFEDIYYFELRNNFRRDKSAAQITAGKSLWSHCHWHDCAYPARLDKDEMASEISGCSCSSSVTGTTLTNYDVYLTSCRDVLINANVFQGRSYSCVYMIGGYGITITNNYFTSQYTIQGSDSVLSVAVNSNEFIRCRTAIYCNGIGSLNANGNTYRKIYYDTNAGAGSEQIHGIWFFNAANGIIFSEDDDGDDSFAFVMGQSSAGIDIAFKNPTLGDTWGDDVVSEGGANYRTNWLPETEVKFEDYDGTTGDCRIWLTDGYIVSTGTGLADTESRTDGAGMKAWRMEPLRTDLPVEMILTIPIGVANEPISISVFVNIAAAAYYAGTYDAPSMTIAGLGMTGDALTDLATAATGWQLLVVSGTPTDVGQITLTLSMETDASGSDAYVYWDDMYVSYKTPVDLGTLDHTYKALPISPPTSSVMTAQNVWAELLADNIISASMGETMNRLGNLAVTGSSINTPAASYTLTTGTQSSGTVANTIPLDGVYHEHTDDGGTTDLYYEFGVGGDGVPTNFIFTGRINGPNDDIDIYGWDWSGSAWVQIGTLEGTALSADTPYDITMFNTMVGSGANLGTVRVRFYSTSLSSSTLRIDQLYCSYAVVARSVGYANGAIWINTNASNTNTERYVDGTADNPVSTWAAAKTLSAALGIETFHVINGSSLTMDASCDNFTILGYDYALALGGQSFENAHISDAVITGTGTAGSGEIHLHSCHIGDVTLGIAHLHDCALEGTFTPSAAEVYIFHDCYSAIPTDSPPELDFNDVAANIALKSWDGRLKLKTMASGSKFVMVGHGALIIDATCDDGGLIGAHGHIELTDNVSGGFAGTLNDDTRYDMVGTDGAALASSFTFDGDGNVHATTQAVGSGFDWGHFPNL